MPVDEAQFYALVRATQWNESIDKFRETGDQALKRKLPAFIFQATFDQTTSKTGKTGAWRKQAATRLTGLVVMDVDHVDDPAGFVNGKLKMENGKLVAREEWAVQNNYPLSIINSQLESILLVYITPSGHGLKIVFKARTDWGNLIDNQHEMAKLLGVEVDESCKDASRMSFICKESDILFIDKELFTYENKEFAERYNTKYRDGHSGAERTNTDILTNTNKADKSDNLTNTNLSNQTNNPSTSSGTKDSSDSGNSCSPINRDSCSQANPNSCSEKDSNSCSPNFKGIPYSEIIAAWWKRNGGEPQEGERNVKLYQLAVNLRAICDNRKDLLLEVMPRLGLDEQEIQRIVDSACKEPPKGISKPMLEILGMGARSKTPIALHDLLEQWGGEIEVLSEDYPLLKDICKGLKRNQYPAAMFVAGGLMMTLMTRCTYRFYHRPEELRRLNNSTLIIGDPASGKSFATRLYNLLAAPIIEADAAGKKAVNAFREQTRTKGANKEKPSTPRAHIRVHPARTSNAQFIRDMVNTVEEVDGVPMQLHMLTFDTELDNTVSLQKGGAWMDKQVMELKAFHNEWDGQFYGNMESEIQDFCVTWNYIYTGTPLALKRKVNMQNFGSGLFSRLTCIPLPPTNFRMLARESHVDYESDERLREWANRLDRVKGLLPLDRIVDELYDWTARRMMDAEENDSQAEELLLKRCAYHGINFAAPYIVMRHWGSMQQDGGYWCGSFETDATDWRLAELICNMQYACQRHYFGAMAEHYFDQQRIDGNEAHTHSLSRTQDAFNRLPDEFKAEDVMNCFQLRTPSAMYMRISRLLKDKYIEKVGEVTEDGSVKALYRKKQPMIF